MSTPPQSAGIVPWRAHGTDVELGLVRDGDGALTVPSGPVAEGHPLAAADAAARAAGLAASPPGPRIELDDGTATWLWPVEVGAESTGPLSWVPVTTAADLLTGTGQRAAEQLRDHPPRVWRQVVLVRHAKAGKRGEFDGPDDQRPLDPRGRAQAEALVGLLATYRPARIVSSDARRSLETVAPLADALRMPVEPEHLLSEDGSVADPEQAMAALRSIVDKPEQTVVSIQRKTIERLLPDLLRDIGFRGDPPPAPRKGGLIVLHVSQALELSVRIEELPPPDGSGPR